MPAVDRNADLTGFGACVLANGIPGSCTRQPG